MKKLYLLLVFLLFLTACGNGKPASSNAASEQAFKPTLDVKMDISGNQVTVYVTTDMKIAPDHYGMARQDGEGHIHMYLDDGEKIGVKEDKKVFPNLAPGHHTLKVSLHNNDHTPYDVQKIIEFDIK